MWWARQQSALLQRNASPTDAVSVLSSVWQGVCEAQATVDAVTRHHHAELASWLGVCERVVPQAACGFSAHCRPPTAFRQGDGSLLRRRPFAPRTCMLTSLPPPGRGTRAATTTGLGDHAYVLPLLYSLLAGLSTGIGGLLCLLVIRESCAWGVEKERTPGERR